MNYSRTYMKFLNKISRVEFEHDRRSLKQKILNAEPDIHPNQWKNEKEKLLHSLRVHNLNRGAVNANRKVWYDVQRNPIINQ